jgi:hypothetical protein
VYVEFNLSLECLVLFRRVRKISKRDYSFIMSLCPSVRSYAWNKSALTGRIFMKFDI